MKIREKINYNNLFEEFEKAKNIKSEYVLIPRLRYQSSTLTSILGISYNSKIDIIKYQNTSMIPLWNHTSLPFICIMIKDINNFAKSIRDNSLILPEELELEYDIFIVNGNEVPVARKLVYPGREDICIDLFNQINMYNQINNIISIWENTTSILYNEDISNNEEFLKILSSKAKDGAQFWKPIKENNNNNLISYVVTLTSNLINVSKGDSVKIEIRNNIPGRPYHHYMTKITVLKPKKKCIIESYMILQKLF